MGEPHDLLDLADGQDLIRHREAGQHDQRHVRLAVERVGELIDPARVDELRARLRRGADDGRVAVARRDPEDHGAGLHQRQVRRVGRAREPVEQRGVVDSRRAPQVVERCFPELLEVERRGDEIIRERQVGGVEWQTVLEPGEVEDGAEAAGRHTRLDVTPRLPELPEVAGGARQDLAARIGDSLGVLVTEAVFQHALLHPAVPTLSRALPASFYAHQTASL